MSENQAVQIRNDLAKMTPEFEKALPPHIPVERFVRVAMTAINTSPNLLACDRQSLFSACTKAAQDGLLPDGKEAALVPFKGKVQYLPMVAGILKKVRNSGELSSITSQIIYEKDQFRYWVDGDGEHLTHEPLIFGDRGKRIGVYALAKTKDGAVYIEPMTVDQVMAVKQCSRAENGPWQGKFEEEMWRKTAIRRLSKRLPMSTDLDDVIRRDDEMYDPDKLNAPAPAKGDKLAAMIGTKPEVEPKQAIEVESTQEETKNAEDLDFNSTP